MHCTERAMEIARQHGMGCVALAHTNHWMRGGSYGWKAAREGFVFIGWTNTIANMPAWGALDPKLGNNPLVLAVPFNRDENSPDSQPTFPEAIVLDMAMSQFSFGSLEDQQLKGKSTPVPAGYDRHGRFSTDPEAVLESKRILPAGYWKGAGLSLLLDILATLLSGGLSTAAISQQEAEYGVSQVFMAIDTSKLTNYSAIYQLVKGIIEDYHRSAPAEPDSSIRYPGERIVKTRQHNFKNGIPVHPQVWNEILALNHK
jgi:3-dehydro-L-gulonate 2-dehydrogenase